MFEDELAVEHDYFSSDPFLWNDEGSYADAGRHHRHNATIEHQHALGEVLGVLLRGRAIRALAEYDHTLFPRFPFLEEPTTASSTPRGCPRCH